MRVVIAGGTGLIGRALVPELQRAGHEAIVLSRSPERVGGLPTGTGVESWDAGSEKGWVDLLDRPSAIVNLAGESIGSGRWTEERKRRVLQSRMSAGQAICRAVSAAKVRPSVVIQASGVGYYGIGGDAVITEAGAAGADWLASVAMRWEASTGDVNQWGVRRVVVRIGTVLSKDGGALPMLLLPFRFFAGGPLGSGRQWMSWIHISDVAGAIRFALERPDLAGAVNLCAPTPLRNREFARELGRILHRPAIFPAPAFALRLILGEMATLVLDGQRVVPERLLQAGYAFRFVAAEPALRSLVLPSK